LRILAFHPGAHDAAAAAFDDYELVAAVSEERLTRQKGSGGGPPWLAVDEVLAIAGWTRADVDVIASTRAVYPATFLRFPIQSRVGHAIGRALGRPPAARRLWTHCRARRTTDTLSVFDRDAFLASSGFRRDAVVHFANHHESHALPAAFFTDWDETVVYTADGIGDNVSYSIRTLADRRWTCRYGDDRWLLARPNGNSLAYAYGFATVACGFRMVRHEGKLTGLAARGEPTLAAEMRRPFWIDGEGLIRTTFRDEFELGAAITRICEGQPRETIAASIQKVVEDLTLESVRGWLQRSGARRLGLAGGLFANVRLNRRLAEECPIDEIFIYPAMGDEGLPVGAALSFLLARDGAPRWLDKRRRLTNLFLGRDYDADVDRTLAADPSIARVSGPPVETAVARLATGSIGAIYSGRMEYGPRALGARSIVANPALAFVTDELNRRLERSEFMPFAPCVLEEDCDRIFHLTAAARYAARFMTITCAIRADWRARLEAIVHVDGTARPQVIGPGGPALLARILRAFRDATGIPALINTSFNVHEEPIVNTPAEAARVLRDRRIDFLITDEGLYTRRD
jgi:carbamoyltransferase